MGGQQLRRGVPGWILPPCSALNIALSSGISRWTNPHHRLRWWVCWQAISLAVLCNTTSVHFLYFFWILIPFWFRTNSLEARITGNLGTTHCLGCRTCNWKDLGSRGWHLWVSEGYWALALCLCYSASGDQIYTSLRLLTATITGQYISCRTVQESEPEDIIVVSLSHTENG